jgi:hypothetical protein
LMCLRFLPSTSSEVLTTSYEAQWQRGID